MNSRMIRQSANTPGRRPDMLFYRPFKSYAGVKEIAITMKKLRLPKIYLELNTVLNIEIEI